MNTLLENDTDLNNNQAEEVKNYYMQVHMIKLQEYVMRALITPDIYMGRDVEIDIQSKHKDKLLLSHGYIENLDEYQVLIEIILTDEEKARLIKLGDLYFYDLPLPISRIKKIYTQDKAAKTKLLKELKNFEAGYMPDNIIDFFKKRTKILSTFKKIDYPSCDFNDDIVINQSENIKAFDKMLGMLAFIKNTNIYYSEEQGLFSNYSNNYFAILSKFNIFIESQETNVLKDIKENKSFFDAIYSDKLIDDDFLLDIVNNSDDSELKDIFKDLIDGHLAKYKALEALRDKGIYFYICLLYIHKQKDSNIKDNFKSNIVDTIPYDKAELALAFLGLYYGYTTLRASEEIGFQDKYFKNILGTRINMKFQLDSKLDLITIESIYKYSFYEKEKGNEFTYLEFPKKKKSIVIPKDQYFKTWYELKSSETYFDVDFVQIIKHNFIALVMNKLEKYKDEIKFGEYYLASYISKYHKHLIHYSKDGKPTEPYCNKVDFIEIIGSEENKPKQNELLEVFKLDKK